MSTVVSERNPYLVSIHAQTNFCTRPHGEVDLHTDVNLPSIWRKAKDTYEKSWMSWKPTAQWEWDRFIALIKDFKTKTDMSQQEQNLNRYERYEHLKELDMSIERWLQPKKDDRKLTDKERQFLTDNIAKLDEQHKQWLNEVLPMMRSNWKQMYLDHYKKGVNDGWGFEEAGDRREYYSWMTVNYPQIIDFILQMLQE